MPRRHPNQMPKPPQLAPFDAKEIRLYSGPADVQSEAEPSHSTKETSVTTVTVFLLFFFFYYEFTRVFYIFMSVFCTVFRYIR